MPVNYSFKIYIKKKIFFSSKYVPVRLTGAYHHKKALSLGKSLSVHVCTYISLRQNIYVINNHSQKGIATHARTHTNTIHKYIAPLQLTSNFSLVYTPRLTPSGLN